jgi:hypothetical protein
MRLMNGRSSRSSRYDGAGNSLGLKLQFRQSEYVAENVNGCASGSGVLSLSTLRLRPALLLRLVVNGERADN